MGTHPLPSLASAIGSIIYAMLCTRPDVSYALSATNRYQSDLGESHWIAIKNILKYLRRTKDMFLVYGGHEELVVNGYTDTSFQNDKDDFRSQSGFLFCLNGGAVSWKSSKQDIAADSTTEAEYIAASEAAKEAVWIKKFVSQLGVMTSASSSMDLYCDNSGAIAQAKEPRSHKSPNTFNGDPLTKPHPQPKHEAHSRAMGITYIHD
uniref:Retrotransposon protein, putative, Ty1-copia subclass n=1 Tax=Oryza sativa subsp. japonica TaxID=39947 RepID=Q2QSB4_ORYSJ|nr:retrotransposon protein, putative, Ty1-copia subclass [Oryza sativa Japonica Group]